jgi:streptomycin 3"-adenylyltransferase
MREELIEGHLPVPKEDLEVIVLVATAYSAHQVLFGPALDTLLPPVSQESLRNAVLASIPEVVAGMDGDERNGVLTLARILVTLDTGQIVSKDAAAEAVHPLLVGMDRVLMRRACDRYLGLEDGAWDSPSGATDALVDRLVSRARGMGSL